MWFKVANTVRDGTVYELKQRMHINEFLKWCAFFELEKYNYTQTDINIAQLCNMFANSKGYKSNITEFLPMDKSDNKPESTLEEFDKKMLVFDNVLKKARGK